MYKKQHKKTITNNKLNSMSSLIILNNRWPKKTLKQQIEWGVWKHKSEAEAEFHAEILFTFSWMIFAVITFNYTPKTLHQ